jgi:hypothetical protein
MDKIEDHRKNWKKILLQKNKAFDNKENKQQELAVQGLLGKLEEISNGKPD